MTSKVNMQEEISKMLETYRYTSVYDDKLSQRLSTLITKIRIADMEEVRNKIKRNHKNSFHYHVCICKTADVVILKIFTNPLLQSPVEIITDFLREADWFQFFCN